MIGPGWMPSRPRPLPRVQRGLLAYTPLYARKRRARRRRKADPTRLPCGRSPFELLGGLEGGPVELPVATLRATRSEARVRLISRHLAYWLRGRWAWLQPRTVPILIAVAGMFAVLGATKYLPALCR